MYDCGCSGVNYQKVLVYTCTSLTTNSIKSFCSHYLVLFLHYILGDLTFPSVSGQCFPPTNGFVIEKLSQNRGIIFGGQVSDSDCSGSTATNCVYIFRVTHNTIVSCYYLDYVYIFCNTKLFSCNALRNGSYSFINFD